MAGDSARKGTPRTPRTPNHVLRNIRENERHETRQQFAEALTRVALDTGADVYPDAKYVERLESGSITWPRSPYRNILTKLCRRPIGELGFTEPIFQASGSVKNALCANKPLRDAIFASGMEISQVARMVGVDTKSVQRWISKGRVPHPSHRWKASQILGCEESELWPEISSASTTNAEGNSRLPRFSPLNPLINKNEWTRDDIAALSTSFDDALASSDTADIELLAHAWLYAQTPQLIELSSGSRISDSLISTIEHRIVQLRRADDYMPGHASHLLVRKEISATGLLLKNSNLTDRQAVRLLASIGELAQLAAFIAADIGKYHAAMNYADGGILAAHAANDAPLAANIISTLSYQLANTGDPRRAAMLARTAYAGALRGSTPISKALFLERIAWADAKSGDLDSCMRALDQVEDKFTAFDPDTDPDWVYWLNREEIDVMAGRCFTELKQPAKAVPLLQNAIAAYDSTHIREISLYQSWLAEDFLLLGEIDAASEISSQVLELGAQIDSARTNDRIKHLASLMDSHNDSRAASEFLDRYKTHTS